MLRPLSQTEQLPRGRRHGMCWEDNGQQDRSPPTISPPHPHTVSTATRGLCTSDVKNRCSTGGRCPRPLSQGQGSVVTTPSALPLVSDPWGYWYPFSLHREAPRMGAGAGPARGDEGDVCPPGLAPHGPLGDALSRGHMYGEAEKWTEISTLHLHRTVFRRQVV